MHKFWSLKTLSKLTVELHTSIKTSNLGDTALFIPRFSLTNSYSSTVSCSCPSDPSVAVGCPPRCPHSCSASTASNESRSAQHQTSTKKREISRSFRAAPTPPMKPRCCSASAATPASLGACALRRAPLPRSVRHLQLPPSPRRHPTLTDHSTTQRPR